MQEDVDRTPEGSLTLITLPWAVKGNVLCNLAIGLEMWLKQQSTCLANLRTSKNNNNKRTTKLTIKKYPCTHFRGNEGQKEQDR
jgi:hypothetical protein